MLSCIPEQGKDFLCFACMIARLFVSDSKSWVQHTDFIMDVLQWTFSLP